MKKFFLKKLLSDTYHTAIDFKIIDHQMFIPADRKPRSSRWLKAERSGNIDVWDLQMRKRPGEVHC